MGSSGLGRLGSSSGLMFFLLFWSALTLMFDSLIGYGMWRQVQAHHFATTEGVITESEIGRRSNSDGTTYAADIVFQYTVNGKPYESDTYRFGAWSSSDRSEARALTRQFPKGKIVTVYYDSADPSRAVLVKGVQGGDLFLALFFTPFNAVMVGGWLALARYWFRRGSGPGGVRQIEESGRIFVQFIPSSPIFSGLIAAGLSAFILTFVIAFGSGLDPSFERMVMVFAVIASVAVLATCIHLIRNVRRSWILEIDPTRRSLTLPVLGHTEPISFDQVRKIDVFDTTSNDNGIYTYYPRFAYLDRTGTKEQVASLPVMATAEDADEFVEWLRETIGLKIPAPTAQTG